MKKLPRWQDWLNLILGVWVFISPWVFGVTIGSRAAWGAWVVGALIVVTALLALSTPEAEWVEHSQVLTAALLFVSPLDLGFTSLVSFCWNVWIVAVIVAALSISAIHSLSHESGKLASQR